MIFGNKVDLSKVTSDVFLGKDYAETDIDLTSTESTFLPTFPLFDEKFGGFDKRAFI